MSKTLLRLLALAPLAALLPAEAAAQQGGAHIPFDSVPLLGMEAFRSPAAGWGVAGEAWADRTRRHHLAAGPGAGVLVHLPGRSGGSHLRTGWEHGDLELEVDVLMPRGSDSGIFLQGRYELQLADGRGVRRPTDADAGGIPPVRAGLPGHPPRLDAGRAPGLWQRFRILFRAPRFDAQGNKTENARLVRVVQNGVAVHENVELAGPTLGAPLQREGAAGPLVLQGGSGPVAFRGLRYKRYSGERVRATGLRYRAWEGDFRSLEEATAGAPAREGEADALASAVARAEDRFAVAYQGTLSVPASGRYAFEMALDWIGDDPGFQGRVVGGGRLLIGGREVLVHDGIRPAAAGAVSLQAGEHPFSLVFYKNRPWTDRSGVELWVEGPGVERHPLHDPTATPVRFPEEINVRPGREAVVLRSFVEHGGGTRTHALSVGDPSGVHYGYDTRAAALLHAWRGPFVETTDMWHSRGETQLARPEGSVLSLPGAPGLALLPDPAAPWPDSAGGAAAPRFLGYDVGPDGRPTFRYRIGAVEVEERILPAADGASLRRELVLRAPGGTTGLYARAAAGERIRRLPDGAYAVGGPGHYVALERGSPRPVVRERDGGQELLLPVRFRRGTARLAYTITW